VEYPYRMEAIYGPNGHVIAWFEGSDYVRDLNGSVIGWVYESAMHGLRGQHVGYFEDGLFRDNSGAVVAWIDGAR
jgi:hypothetical protein